MGVATVANHTLWEIEVMAVAFAVFAVVLLSARRVALRRHARVRRAGAFGFQDHDVLERGVGPAGFGAVSASVTSPLAPSFGAPGSSDLPAAGPAPSLAPEFVATTNQVPTFVVPEGKGDDRGPAPGWVLPPDVSRSAPTAEPG